MPTYTGTSSAETINGSAGDDIIDGQGGDDLLNGGGGDDLFLYRTGRGFYSAGDGDGADTVNGGTGLDTLQVLGDALETFQGSNSFVDYPAYALSADGEDALFVTTQIAGVYGEPPATPHMRVVTLNGVESVVFEFLDAPPPPPNFPTGSFGWAYSTDDVLTIGDLTGTDLLGQIAFNGAHGDDTLNASAATNDIIADGGVGDDILATGSGDDQLTGGDGNDLLRAGAGSNTLAGGLGLDTADYSGAAAGVHVDLNEGRAVNNGHGLEDTISGVEHLTGSAHDDILIGEGSTNWLIGAAGADYLIGLGGDDLLDGGGGAPNALQGGLGDDTYVVWNVGDTVIEFAGEGIDGVETVLSTYVLKADFENLVYTGSAAFTGRGNAAANIISGGQLVDRLYGEAGDDILNGGAGSDHFHGGAGNDTLNGGAFSGDNADYSLAASAVYVNLTNGLTSNDGDGGVDALISIEAATGSAFNDVLIGDGQANLLNGGLGSDVLVGLAGDDLLVGGGGGGNQMQGGLGNDTYRVSAVGDTLVENAAEGYDRVEVWLQSYALRDHFESLHFMGTGSFTGSGNALDNNVSGGASNDILSGLGGHDSLGGGDGLDSLLGGDGNDWLFGDAGDDALSGGDGDDALNGGTGSDIMAGDAGNDAFDGGDDGVDIADYSASAVGLTLRVTGSNNDGLGGTDTLVRMEGLIGTASNDTLIGDQASNTLSGGQGSDVLLGFAGNDILIGGGAPNQMQGGVGDDRYVMTAGDTLVEFAGEGTDTIEMTLSAYALRDNFENLTYTGAGAFTGTGNAVNNVLTGAAGADTFTGRQGDDTIHGNGGVDTVVMSGARDDYTIQAGADYITIGDSVVGRDGIDTLYGIERIRFSDGTVLELGAAAAPLSSPAAEALAGPDASSLWNDF